MTPEQQQQREELRRVVAEALALCNGRIDPDAWLEDADAAIAICARRFAEVAGRLADLVAADAAGPGGPISPYDAGRVSGATMSRDHIVHEFRAFAGEG